MGNNVSRLLLAGFLLTLTTGFQFVSCGTAAGQVVAAYYNDDGDFGYDIQSMPDLDQRRAGLLNDGNMHCAPTATMNLFAYAANFGYPGLLPGPGLWEGTPGHATMTNYLGVLGLVMETDEDDGTFFAPMVDGANSWIIGQQLMISANARKAGFWPTIDDLAEIAVNGGLVQYCYGRYDWQLIADRPFLTNRDSGHCVTLELAFANNGQLEGPRLIHHRNPSTNDSDLNSNSNYSSSNINAAENLIIATSMLDGGTTVEYLVTALNPPAGQYRIIDSYLSLFPNGGAGFTGVQLNSSFVGGGLGFVQDQLPTPFGPPPGQTIISAIQHPLSYGTLVLTAAPESPVQLHETRHSGRSRHLLDLPEGAMGLTPGPGTQFIIHFPNELLISSWQSGGTVAKPESIPLPIGFDLQTAAFDFDSGELFVLSGNECLVFFLGGAPTQFLSFPVLGIGNAQFLDSVIHDGEFFGVLTDDRIVKAALNSLDEEGPIQFSVVNLPPLVVSPIAIDFDNNGRMYVSDQQQGLLEFVPNGNGGWQLPKQFNFVGQFPPGSRFVAFRNQTNIQPGELDEEQWRNILPKELLPLGPDVPD